MERTVAELGRLDTLINNAGVMLLGPGRRRPARGVGADGRLNVQGLLYCAHAALPHLLARGPGRAPARGRHGQHQLGGRTDDPQRQRVYNLTKYGVGAFSDSLRQEVTGRHVRVSLVEPGAIDTELRTHNRPEIQEQMEQRFGGIELLQAQDIAEAIAYIVTRPWRVAVNEILIRPTEQEG